MNIAALRPVLCMPGCASRSSSSTLACGASACAHDAPAMPAPTMTASKSGAGMSAARGRPKPLTRPLGGPRAGRAWGQIHLSRTLARIAHQRALAEQALDQVDRQVGGLV